MFLWKTIKITIWFSTFDDALIIWLWHFIRDRQFHSSIGLISQPNLLQELCDRERPCLKTQEEHLRNDTPGRSPVFTHWHTPVHLHPHTCAPAHTYIPLLPYFSNISTSTGTHINFNMLPLSLFLIKLKASYVCLLRTLQKTVYPQKWLSTFPPGASQWSHWCLWVGQVVYSTEFMWKIPFGWLMPRKAKELFYFSRRTNYRFWFGWPVFPLCSSF